MTVSTGGRLGRGTLIALVTAEFFITLDGSALTVALPTIRDSLDLNAAALQWTQIAYMVAAAALALPFGAMGDRLGRRRVLATALGLFLTGAVLTATAQSTLTLIVGRGVTGAGATGILVLALAMLTAGVPGARVPAVVGTWTALSSAASVVAPAFSGYLIESAGWRWLFLVSVVPAILVLLAVLRAPEDDDSSHARVDWWGSALLTMATVFLVAGINSLATGSVSVPLLGGSLLLGVLLFAAFVRQQRRTTVHLTDWALMRRYPTGLLLALRWVLALVFTGVAYQQTMLLQNAMGYTPMAAGLMDVPPALAATAAAAVSAPVLKRAGMALSVGAGFALMAVGLFGLAQADLSESVMLLVGSFILIGAGFGLNTSVLSAGVLEQLPPRAKGGGAGMLNLINSVASILGIAMVGAAVSFWVTQSWLSRGGASSCPGNPDLISDVIAGAMGEVDAQCGATVQEVAVEAYFDGITDALLAAALLLGIAAFFAMSLLRRKRADTPGTSEAGCPRQVREDG